MEFDRKCQATDNVSIRVVAPTRILNQAYALLSHPSGTREHVPSQNTGEAADQILKFRAVFEGDHKFLFFFSLPYVYSPAPFALE